ncbi:MAG: SurA N-terminal domain-containing protein [Candidatus Nomurabacteria bacterium]|jgi:hypothetical protein|nr:SurA N-terminal domain-containing protein [Candidatus Nomurabacteria bacterium]
MIKRFLNKRKAKKTVEETGGRITNDTVEAHREVILSKGRKFKYPLQYAKHKLVINTIIIGVLAIGAACVIGWVQYYKLQNTGTVAYRFSKYLRLPVAEVDGQTVLYSDYLMQYRSNTIAIERQEGKLSNKDDAERQINYYKRMAMDNSILNAYAIKLAKEYDIEVNRGRIDKVYGQHVASGDNKVTESGFEKLIEDNFGLSIDEYRRMFIELPLLRQDVSVRIDTKAKELVKEVESALSKNGGNFENVAKRFSDKVFLEPSGGLVSVQNFDGGRAAEADKLKVGGISKPFLSTSGDGYYIVKLLKKEDRKVEYASLRIPLTELKNRIEQLKKDGKIKEYITIKNE